MAEILGATPTQVSVKATTTDGMGSRGAEGIAARPWRSVNEMDRDVGDRVDREANTLVGSIGVGVTCRNVRRIVVSKGV
jgi:hypothetical protein